MRDPLDYFIKRHKIPELDAAALRSLQLQKRELAANEGVVSAGDWLEYCVIVIDGYVGRAKVTADGRQQFVNIYIEGDFPDLSSLFLPTVDADLFSLGNVTVGKIHRESIIELIAARPSILAAFWRELAIDASITREWVLNVGRRNAEERMAHFFLEMHDRVTRNRGTVNSLKLPLTQMHIADVIGVSPVHVNRVLQNLRGLGLLKLAHRSLQIQNRDGLAALAGYDPAYLHQKDKVLTSFEVTPRASDLGGSL